MPQKERKRGEGEREGGGRGRVRYHMPFISALKGQRQGQAISGSLISIVSYRTARAT